MNKISVELLVQGVNTLVSSEMIFAYFDDPVSSVTADPKSLVEDFWCPVSHSIPNRL